MRIFYSIITLLLLPFVIIAQSTLITPGTSQANIIANGTTNGGITPPRLTALQIAAITSPTVGSMVYDTDNNCLRIFDGTKWKCQTENTIADITGYGFGGSGNQIGYDIEVVGDYIYVAGNFENEIIFYDDNGPIYLYSSGGKDGFVAKLRKDGKAEWVRQMQNTLDCTANQVKVDASGFVFVGGTHKGTVNISGITLYNTNNENDIFFAKYSNAGVFQWTQLMAGAGNDTLTAMGIDNNNNLHFTGSFKNPLTFFSTNGSIGATISNSYNAVGMFYVKYSNAGAYVSSKTGTGFYDVIGSSLCLDTSNNIYITGTSSGTMTFDGLTFNPNTASYPAKSQARAYGFLIKVLSTNTTSFVGEVGEYKPTAVAVDNSGNIYVASAITALYSAFGSPTIPTIRLAKFSTTLTKVWTKYQIPANWGTTYCNITSNELFFPNYLVDISIANNSVFVAGLFFCSAVFDVLNYDINYPNEYEFTEKTLAKKSKGTFDAVLIEYNLNGELQNVNQLGGIGFDEFNALKAISANEVYGIGSYSNTVVWGQNTTTSTGSRDMFLLKLSK